jgi:hypothetical protein
MLPTHQGGGSPGIGPDIAQTVWSPKPVTLGVGHLDKHRGCGPKIASVMSPSGEQGPDSATCHSRAVIRGAPGRMEERRPVTRGRRKPRYPTRAVVSSFRQPVWLSPRGGWFAFAGLGRGHSLFSIRRERHMNPIKAANPVTVTKGAFRLAGTAAGLAGTAARRAVHAPVAMTRSAADLAGSSAALLGTAARGAGHALRTDHDDEHAAPSPGAGSPTSQDAGGAGASPTVVLTEPRAPEEPPVDVVGEALAAEAAAQGGQGHDGGGLAHEPRGASRDEEHGDAALLRAEVEEIAQETAAALEGDLEPEEHLTEPLLDSGDAKAMASELATMSKAADTDKG